MSYDGSLFALESYGWVIGVELLVILVLVIMVLLVLVIVVILVLATMVLERYVLAIEGFTLGPELVLLCWGTPCSQASIIMSCRARARNLRSK